MTHHNTVCRSLLQKCFLQCLTKTLLIITRFYLLLLFIYFLLVLTSYCFFALDMLFITTYLLIIITLFQNLRTLQQLAYMSYFLLYLIMALFVFWDIQYYKTLELLFVSIPVVPLLKLSKLVGNSFSLIFVPRYKNATIFSCFQFCQF